MKTLRLDGAGFDPLRLALDRFSENINDPRPIFEDMADEFARTQAANFGSGGGVHGYWAPLSASYGAWKAENYPGAPILTRSGDLRDSMTRRPFDVEVIDTRRMVIGTAISYAKYHQQGGTNLPRRPIINPLTHSEQRQFGKILHRHAFQGVLR